MGSTVTSGVVDGMQAVLAFRCLTALTLQILI